MPQHFKPWKAGESGQSPQGRRNSSCSDEPARAAQPRIALALDSISSEHCSHLLDTKLRRIVAKLPVVHETPSQCPHHMHTVLVDGLEDLLHEGEIVDATG